MQKTVLVVEDEPIIRAVAGLLIEEAGYDVLEAANADDAIVLLEAHPEIRVLFSHLGVPGRMNGLKLIHAVRKRWPPVVLILTSGQTPPHVNDTPLDTLFLGKPYSDRELLDALQAVDWDIQIAA